MVISTHFNADIVLFEHHTHTIYAQKLFKIDSRRQIIMRLAFLDFTIGNRYNIRDRPRLGIFNFYIVSRYYYVVYCEEV